MQPLDQNYMSKNGQGRSLPNNQVIHTLEVKRLQVGVDQRVMLTDVTFSVSTQQILFIRGPSGVGKSLLLKAIACLIPMQTGELYLDQLRPKQFGIPRWRSDVMYVPARKPNLKGTPGELYFAVQRHDSMHNKKWGDLPNLIFQLGLSQETLHMQWSQLSDGQAQRVIIAISISLNPKVLLLDEPTSHLDQDTCKYVEELIQQTKEHMAIVWVTHDHSVPRRVGGRVLDLPMGQVVTISAVDLSDIAEEESMDRTFSQDGSEYQIQSEQGGQDVI
eukprot:TRINITY_DN4035_c0_g1_i1.p1 TRINITY_DN4035_c0_g1~~TRINITY_DN4035_c0_g1_i1.p1  ORF type:complete len:275 (-),score=26.27 TRINITY_DN4035_c0_g1_i1:395-1219(-)